MRPLYNNVLIKQTELVKEEKTTSGLILLQSNFNQYQFGDDNQRVQDIISKKKQNKGEVINVGHTCTFVKEGDIIIYKKQSEKCSLPEDEYSLIVEEENILAKEIDGSLIPNHNYTLVKVTKQSR